MLNDLKERPMIDLKEHERIAYNLKILIKTNNAVMLYSHAWFIRYSFVQILIIFRPFSTRASNASGCHYMNGGQPNPNGHDCSTLTTVLFCTIPLAITHNLVLLISRSPKAFLNYLLKTIFSLFFYPFFELMSKYYSTQSMTFRYRLQQRGT